MTELVREIHDDEDDRLELGRIVWDEEVQGAVVAQAGGQSVGAAGAGHGVIGHMAVADLGILCRNDQVAGQGEFQSA